MLTGASHALWEGLEAVRDVGTAAGDKMRELTSAGVERSSRSLRTMTAAGEAIVRAKCPADLMNAQQTLFRASAVEMSSGMVRIGGTLLRTMQAMSGHWSVPVAAAVTPTPWPVAV